MCAHRTDSGSPLDTAIISVSDLDESLAFYRDLIGLSVIGMDTATDAGANAYWQVPAGTPVRSALLGHGPDPVGRLQLMQFGAGNGRLIRDPTIRRATGLINLNFYTEDIHADFKKFSALGYPFWSEPVQHDFGPKVGTPIEVVFDGPNGMAINLVELITPNDNTLIGEMRSFVADFGRTATGYTPVVTSAHTVESTAKAVDFYTRVLGMHVAIDEELNSDESNRFLGLESGARTRTVFVQGAHMFGKVALAEPLNYICASLIEQAVAPNLGYLAQSFRVDDLDAARSACRELGAEIYSDIRELELIGRGHCRAMLVRNPGSGALQEIYQA